MSYERIEEFLNEAGEAKNNKSYASAKRYYNAVLDIEPSNWEAKMYIAILNYMNISCSESDFAIDAVRNSLYNVAEAIKNNNESKKMRNFYCCDIANDAAKFAFYICELQYQEFDRLVMERNYYNRLSPVKFSNQYIYPRYRKLAEMMYDLGDRLENGFTEGEGLAGAKNAWDAGNTLLKLYLAKAGFFEKQQLKSRINFYKKKCKN